MKKIAIFALKSSVVTIIILLFVTLVSVIYIGNRLTVLQSKIYPNVIIDNINFGEQNRNDLKKYLTDKRDRMRKITIEINYNDLQIATISGQNLDVNLNIDRTLNDAYDIGRNKNLVIKWRQRLLSILNLRRFNFKSKLSFSDKALTENLQGLEDTYNIPPQDALFRFENGKVTGFKIEQNGLQIDREDTFNQFKNIINQIESEKSEFQILVKDKVIKPKINLEAINNFGIVEKIGEGKSNYKGSIASRIHNVILASSKFDGVLIPQNEEFSFNKTIGDISANTGYLQAYIIKDGRTILGDGGGVCQVSTTLFRAALNSGLPITKRTAHAYRVHYYENDSKPGFDATVYSPSTDFRFKNDTPAYILIQRELNKETMDLKFVFYGKKD